MVMVDHRSMHRLVLDRLMFPPLDRRAAQNQIHRARNGRIKKKSNNLYYDYKTKFSCEFNGKMRKKLKHKDRGGLP